MKWWLSYPYDCGKQHIYSRYKTAQEYSDFIPIDLKLSILKITIRETPSWIEYFELCGCWPTTKQINKARGNKFRQDRHYTVEDLIIDDNFEEHY